MDQVEIRDNPGEDRYELRVDGELAGFVTYRLEDGRITLVHTEVDDEHSARGLGTLLARWALDDARRRGLAIVPACPFIVSIVRKDPDEYLDAIAPGARAHVMKSD